MGSSGGAYTKLPPRVCSAESPTMEYMLWTKINFFQVSGNFIASLFVLFIYNNRFTVTLSCDMHFEALLKDKNAAKV